MSLTNISEPIGSAPNLFNFALVDLVTPQSREVSRHRSEIAERLEINPRTYSGRIGHIRHLARATIKALPSHRVQRSSNGSEIEFFRAALALQISHCPTKELAPFAEYFGVTQEKLVQVVEQFNNSARKAFEPHFGESRDPSLDFSLKKQKYSLHAVRMKQVGLIVEEDALKTDSLPLLRSILADLRRICAKDIDLLHLVEVSGPGALRDSLSYRLNFSPMSDVCRTLSQTLHVEIPEKDDPESRIAWYRKFTSKIRRLKDAAVHASEDLNDLTASLSVLNDRLKFSFDGSDGLNKRLGEILLQFREGRAHATKSVRADLTHLIKEKSDRILRDSLYQYISEFESIPGKPERLQALAKENVEAQLAVDKDRERCNDRYNRKSSAELFKEIEGEVDRLCYLLKKFEELSEEKSHDCQKESRPLAPLEMEIDLTREILLNLPIEIVEAYLKEKFEKEFNFSKPDSHTLTWQILDQLSPDVFEDYRQLSPFLGSKADAYGEGISQELTRLFGSSVTQYMYTHLRQANPTALEKEKSFESFKRRCVCRFNLLGSFFHSDQDTLGLVQAKPWLLTCSLDIFENELERLSTKADITRCESPRAAKFVTVINQLPSNFGSLFIATLKAVGNVGISHHQLTSLVHKRALCIHADGLYSRYKQSIETLVKDGIMKVAPSNFQLLTFLELNFGEQFAESEYDKIIKSEFIEIEDFLDSVRGDPTVFRKCLNALWRYDEFALKNYLDLRKIKFQQHFSIKPNPARDAFLAQYPNPRESYRDLFPNDTAEDQGKRWSGAAYLKIGHSSSEAREAILKRLRSVCPVVIPANAQFAELPRLIRLPIREDLLAASSGYYIHGRIGWDDKVFDAAYSVRFHTNHLNQVNRPPTMEVIKTYRHKDTTYTYSLLADSYQLYLLHEDPNVSPYLEVDGEGHVWIERGFKKWINDNRELHDKASIILQLVHFDFWWAAEES